MVSMNMNSATVHEQRHLRMDSATGMNGALRLQTQDMAQGKRRPEVAAWVLHKTLCSTLRTNGRDWIQTLLCVNTFQPCGMAT